MKLEMTKHYSAAGKWDFSVEFEGKEYHTVRATVGLIDRLSSSGELSASEMIALARELFHPDDQEAIDQWPIEPMLAMIPAYLAYFGEAGLKNLAAIAQSARSAIAPSKATNG